MSKATLWDVFESAMGTAQLITGDIAKYKIEQDEAEIRKFELEQKQKMADFDLELQGKTDFDNFDKYYNEFMDKQEKDLMSRIKTNAGSKVAKEWFDSQRVNNQIQVDKIETSLRKNHILLTNEDSARMNKEIYQGMELYNRDKAIYDSEFKNGLINEAQYHAKMDQVGKTVLDQRLNNIVDEAANNCESLDQMIKYVDKNFNFDDLDFKIFNPVGDGMDVDNKGTFDLASYKERGKELVTGLWNTKVKRIQDSNYSFITEEISNMYGEIETNPQGVLNKIGQCFQYMNDNPGNKFDTNDRLKLSKELDSLRKKLEKGDTAGAGTSVAKLKLGSDLKAGDIASFIADYKAGIASGYDVRNLVVDSMFKEAKSFGYTGSKSDWVKDNLSTNQKIIELLQDSIPDRAKGLSTAAENLCKSSQFKELKESDPTLAGQIEEDLANFAVDLALETKWDGEVNVADLTKRLETRYNSLLLKTSQSIADKNIKSQKDLAQQLKLTTGEAGEEFVYTDKNGIQVWLPGGKQAIQKEGGIQETGANLISEITGVSVDNIIPSFKTTKGGNDISSEIQYRVGSDIYELKPTENGKEVDVYKNGERLGNAYTYKQEHLDQEQEKAKDSTRDLKAKQVVDFETQIQSFKSFPYDKSLGVKEEYWNDFDDEQKLQQLRALYKKDKKQYEAYVEKHKTELGL